MKKKNSVYIAKEDNCLFTEQFAFWNKSDWNNDIPPYFKRLNKINDDRSFVILALAVLEYQIDRFLKAFIPKYDVLIKSNTNISTKIDIIKAFNLIPTHIVDMVDLLRNIRNVFAHYLEIDGFEDEKKSKKLPNYILLMKEYKIEYNTEMPYWKDGEPIRLLFKDIWRVCLEALRIYEGNIKLFRQETEKREYINYLKSLSIELEEKRNMEEKKRVIKKLTTQKE
jgi:hypothetical protein